MKNKFNKEPLTKYLKGRRIFLKGLPLFLILVIATGCDDFVHVELPKDQLINKTVFQDVDTATSALRHLYSGMRALSFNHLGLYADELDINNPNSFYDHTITLLDGTVSNLWSSYYNLIYSSNAIIEGVESSATLSLEDKDQLKGEALFIRAYIHWLLVELFGSVPYITTTDYIRNTNVSRMPIGEVYDHIILDLEQALNLLGEDISEFPEERIRVYDAVAKALLARVYLFTGEWELAEEMSSNVISRFIFEPDLNKVFLKNSSESIWQFKPSVEGENTEQGKRFIFAVSPSFTQPVLSASIVNAFETSDLRKSNWIGSVTSATNTYYYAFKYKEAGATTPTSIEYPIVFRLAEQYLIRSEARVQLGNILGAQSDLNVIRNRAGLENTMASTTNELLDAILQERFVELFTEGGHRWFDLKRMEKAAEVLAPIKPAWRDTDILFPIPESEILLNPNLLPQNDGYN